MAVQAHYHHHYHRESPFLVSGAPEGSRLAAAMELHHQAQLQKRTAMGLRLDFDEGSEHVSCTSPASASASCLLSKELAAQRDQHRNEMDRLIQEHADRLRCEPAVPAAGAVAAACPMCRGAVTGTVQVFFS
ncbi:Retrotransposon protein [Zea mays]|uniref:Retrotransposon protein n=1 Tax=Zea mays TaxID=4577 RepID=A0A1D6K8U0_MAIZE|nr:Retrotransposon protein [Zea mays]